MHAGDDRLRHAGDGQHQLAALPEQRLHEFLAVIGAHFLEVVAGTEGLAGAGDDDDAHGFAGGDGVEFGCSAVNMSFDSELNWPGRLRVSVVRPSARSVRRTRGSSRIMACLRLVLFESANLADGPGKCNCLAGF